MVCDQHGAGIDDRKLTEAPTPESKIEGRSAVLAEADRLINGDRAQTYGDAKDSFTAIAAAWNALGFRVIPPKGDESFVHRGFTAHDVALAMVALKLHRASSQPGHVDSYVDLAGYAALASEMGS